jgi:2',3'-cyclic-nucleotide 2'-phosphodiesterase (5'-nucleotidase family)
VAKTDVDLVINEPSTLDKEEKIRLVRNAETNLGDLCADAYRYVTGADIALVNGGGVRVDIRSGDITNNDIISVHPFGNAVCVVEADGQTILDALEMGARVTPEECGGFLQVSGLTYEINTEIESSVQVDENGMFVSVDGEYRVQNVMVGDEPLDLNKTYTVASHNYMLKSAGDGMCMFQDCNIVLDEIMLDNEALRTYILEGLGGVVGEQYADPYGEGRIVAIE